MQSINEIRNNLYCNNCPAIDLRTQDELIRIVDRINLKEKEVNEIGEPNLIILCESFPHGVYIYDIDNPAEQGLRHNLKLELYGEIDDIEFLKRLREDKIIIADCAYCQNMC